MHYKLDPDVIQRINDANDIVELIEEYLPLKKVGANYSTNCPFHKEKTPSFVVSPDKQIYHCFGCGESGDNIKFLMKYKNYTFVEAAEYLARRGGIVLEVVKHTYNNNNKQLIDRLLLINREAAIFFYNNLKRQVNAIEYLKSRQIDEDVIKKFGIGYAINDWDNLLKHLLEKGFKEADILKTGLIIKRENSNSYFDRFRNRIMFPIFDIKKNIIGFGGRVLDASLPKYLNSPESIVYSKGNNVYGLNYAKEDVKDRSFFIVEGYMDVIKMHIHGYKTAVAPLGTALTENQIKLMKRYSKNFYITFDADEAGQRAALKAINMLKKNNLNGKVVIIPDSKDPDEYLNTHGKAKFDKLIENALDYYSFLEFYYEKYYENSNKVEYINNFFDNIVNVNSEIEKELIFEKLAAKVGVSKEAIIKEYYKKTKQKTFVKNAPKPPLKMKVEKITTSHEIELIKLILCDNSLARYLKEIVNEHSFEDLEYYSVFSAIYEYYVNHTVIHKDNLGKILKDKMDVSIFVQDEEVDYNNLEALFMDCMKRLKIKYYERKKAILSEKIKQSDESSVNNKMIMNEIFSLAKKIKSTKEEVC